MKIVQINACYERGSTGRMMKEMHQYFLKHGYDSYACAPNCHSNDFRLINIGCKFDYLLHSLLSRILGLQGYFSILSTILFLRKLSKIKPDILHLHNLHNNYINLPILFRYIKKNNIATVVTMHDFWFMTGHCCYFTNDNCYKWQKSCGHCPAIKTYNKSWFWDHSSWLRKMKERYFTQIKRLAIIGNSKWTTTEIKKSFLGKSSIATHIYNWIDTDVFYPRNRSLCRLKHGFKETDIIILGVAQGWNMLKGLEVIKKLATRNKHYKFVLIGEILDNKKLPTNIISIGTIKNTSTLAEFYSLSDVYINPSIQETFGLVTAEAIACGLPVVANNATATPELVLEGCGLIVDNNNIEEFEKDIKDVIRAHKSPDAMHTLAEVEFGKENISKYLGVYKKLLAYE